MFEVLSIGIEVQPRCILLASMALMDSSVLGHWQDLEVSSIWGSSFASFALKILETKGVKFHS